MENSSIWVVFWLAIAGGVISFSKEICEAIFGKEWPKSSKIVVASLGILVFGIAAYLNSGIAETEAEKKQTADSIAKVEKRRADFLASVHDSITNIIKIQSDSNSQLLKENKDLSVLNFKLSQDASYYAKGSDDCFAVPVINPDRLYLFIYNPSKYPLRRLKVGLTEHTSYLPEKYKLADIDFIPGKTEEAFLPTQAIILHVVTPANPIPDSLYFSLIFTLEHRTLYQELLVVKKKSPYYESSIFMHDGFGKVIFRTKPDQLFPNSSIKYFRKHFFQRK